MADIEGDGNPKPKKPKLDPNDIAKKAPGALQVAADNGTAQGPGAPLKVVPIRAPSSKQGQSAKRAPPPKAKPKGKLDKALDEIRNSPGFDVRYNEFSCQFFVNGEPMEKEIHAFDLAAQLGRKSVKGVGIDMAHAVLKREGRANSFNPVVDELRALRWDRVDRLTTVFPTYFAATGDPAYLERVGPWFFIGHVARLLVPGSRQDSMLVLEGGEGLGKTQFCRLLARGEEYYRENLPDLHTADAKEALIGRRVVEMCELVALNSVRSQETFKAFASSPTDNVRLPYGERSQRHPRTASIIGTTNSDKYLSSEHGNRRVWGVECGDIDLAGLERDLPMILAEAVTLFDLAQKWWPDKSEQLSVFHPQQEARLEDDPLVEAIVSGFYASPERKIRSDWTARELFDLALDMPRSKFKIEDWLKVGRKMFPAAMRKAGFEPIKSLAGGHAKAGIDRGYGRLWKASKELMAQLTPQSKDLFQ